ncbi:MAG: deoxyribonuclease IV [Dehalococcoidia bacterium]|nr:deoxyribonuclease IV [Dehalococcoidia bacterium]
MKIGAHVSSAGGVDKAVDRAVEIGCEALQMFCSPPQSWAVKPVPKPTAAAFREKLRQSGVGPAFLHAIYMINLGSPNPENLKKSMDALVSYMEAAAEIGAQGVIFHCGSHKGTGVDGGIRQLVAALRQVLERSPDGPWLMMENSAGMGDHLCSKFEDIGLVIKELNSPRMRVCLDIQHTFAAGYDVAHAPGLHKAMQEFDLAIGLDRLGAVHANDSKTPLGSAVDRHENIGDGQIGASGFEVILAHPAFRNVPFLLEVPGIEGKGPDKENVDRLKALRQKAGGNR